MKKKFEEIENFITSLSVNNHILGTPEKEKESEREFPSVFIWENEDTLMLFRIKMSLMP